MTDPEHETDSLFFIETALRPSLTPQARNAEDHVGEPLPGTPAILVKD